MTMMRNNNWTSNFKSITSNLHMNYAIHSHETIKNLETFSRICVVSLKMGREVGAGWIKRQTMQSYLKITSHRIFPHAI